MKKLSIILIATMLSIVAYSQEPTQIPAGGNPLTWRTIINSNAIQIYDSFKVHLDTLRSHRNAINLNYSFIRSNADSITKIKDVIIPLRAPLNNPEFIGIIKLNTDTVATLANLRSFQFSVDTTYLSARIDLKAPINNPQFTGVARLVTDTLATRAYARTYGGTGTTTIDDVRSEIGDSLNNLRPGIKVGDGTAGPFFDGTSDGGQLLKFYGNKGFWTGLQGGAPIANRSYRLPIDPLPSAGDSSLINIDANGNMGFVSHNHYVKVADTINAEPGSYPSLWMFQQGMSNKVFVADSNKTSKGGYVTPKALMDSINLYAGGMTQEAVSNLVSDSILANAGNVAGITLNGGTLTLTGDLATADDITIYTNGDSQYDLPAGGGNLTVMSQVQGWIGDSINKLREDAEIALAPVDSNLYVTPYALTEAINAIEGSVINDSLYRRYTDTISLNIASVGRNILADTALFENGIWAGYQRWGGNDTLEIKYVNSYLGQGSGTETLGFNIYYSDTLGAVIPTKVFNTDITCTSVIPTTGKTNTSFANSKIPPNSYMWVPVSGVSAGNRPSLFGVTLSGNLIAGDMNTLLDSLIAYWKFDETSGTAIADALGTFNGTTTGTVNQTGILDKAVSYGTTTKTTITTTTGFNKSDEYYTVSLWVKFNTLPSTWGAAGGIIYRSGYFDGSITTGGQLQLGFKPSSPTGESRYCYKIITPALDTWYHLVWMSNGVGNSVTGYVNGVALNNGGVIATATFDQTLTGSIFVGNSYNDIMPFDGLIDEVAVWGRRLTAEEVALLYNSGAGRAIK